MRERGRRAAVPRGVDGGEPGVCRGALAPAGSLAPVGERVDERPGEGANRANHEPVTAITTRVAGDPAGGAVGSLIRPAANAQPA